MDFFLWIQLAIVCLLGAMSPGPSLALIIRNSIRYNRLSGIVTSMGHGTGIAIYAVIVVIGLELIIRTNQFLFFLIQICGSFFLMIIGILFILDNKKLDEGEQKFNNNSFIQGFSLAIINPKILIWFTAIYSQFVRVNAHFMEKSILVLTASIIDVVWYSIVAILVTGYGLKNFFQKKKYFIQKIMGYILVFIALILIYKILIA